MWRVDIEQQEGGRRQYWRWFHGDVPVSFEEFLNTLAADENCCEVFLRTLRETPFVALRWECPPLSRANRSQPFECVIHDAPDLDVTADRRDFAAHFTAEAVVSFDNLGADARLVVPCPQNEAANYSHLLSFVRTAHASQQQQWVQHVATETLSCVSSQPLWLNTAGGGVDWLHVRLDSRPKYYHYDSFRHWPTRPAPGAVCALQWQ
jgi:hypothetical protein